MNTPQKQIHMPESRWFKQIRTSEEYHKMIRDGAGRVLMVFGIDGCGACNLLLEDFSRQEVLGVLEELTLNVGYINMLAIGRIVDDSISAFPTIKGYEDGRFVGRITGYGYNLYDLFSAIASWYGIRTAPQS